MGVFVVDVLGRYVEERHSGKNGLEILGGINFGT